MHFLYTIDEWADEPVMLINKHIGMDAQDGAGIMGNQFQEELLALDSGRFGTKRCIKVYINSAGGSISDGMNIYSAIVKSAVPVDTYCTGMAASTAGWIFQAGRRRVMADYGFLMMHNPYSPAGEDDTGMLETFANSCAVMLAARCDKTVAEVRKLMNAETWLNATAAKEQQFCDTIEPSNGRHKERMAAAESVSDKLKAGALILNSILPQPIKQPKEKQTMLYVTNALKLCAEAGEDAIVQEITHLQNRVQKAEAAKAVLENKLDLKEALTAEKDTEIARLKNELQMRLTETEKMRQDKAVAEAAAHLVRCEQMVKSHAAANKIRNEAATISRWVDKAVQDFEGTEALLKDLGANASAPILRPAGGTNSIQQKNAIGYQAEIMAKLKNRGR